MDEDDGGGGARRSSDSGGNLLPSSSSSRRPAASSDEPVRTARCDDEPGDDGGDGGGGGGDVARDDDCGGGGNNNAVEDYGMGAWPSGGANGECRGTTARATSRAHDRYTTVVRVAGAARHALRGDDLRGFFSRRAAARARHAAMRWARHRGRSAWPPHPNREPLD